MTPSLLRALDRDLSGDVVRPGDAGYDDARAVWNTMIDRRPDAVVRCLTEADVAAAVRFAAETAPSALAVRGGGHSVAGAGVCDGGLVIDLSRMRSVSIDPASRKALVEGGARWSDVDGPGEAHGLHTTGGVVSTTGVAGLTLGGGMGWLSRLIGHACDNMTAARVVTAAGETVEASEAGDRELLWGLRGGGGNFGVVTRFEFALHPVTEVVAGWLKFPHGAARSVLSAYRDVMAEAPDSLSAAALLTTDRDLGPIAALVPCYFGSAAGAGRWIDALRSAAPALYDDVGPRPYAAHQRIYETPPPPPMGHYWRSAYLQGLDAGAIDALIAAAQLDMRYGHTVSLEALGGAAGRVAEDHAAFGHRAAPLSFLADGGWPDPADAERSIAWSRRASDLMAPHLAAAGYSNYQSDDGPPEPAERIRRAFGPGRAARLTALKDRYDPGNMFRINHNIPPSNWTPPGP